MKRPPEMTPLHQVAWALGWDICKLALHHDHRAARGQSWIVRDYLLISATAAEREIIFRALRLGAKGARGVYGKPIAVDKQPVS